ncbi:MAG: hypothetical protein M3441_13120 [Chloroflexota bacterium]|nr:hypothetical protein [Chloroflexota bacterium]
MNLFQSLRRNLREFYDQYPLVGCASWAAFAVAGFVLLLLLPPEVVDLLSFIFSVLSLCSFLFGSD